MRDVLMFLLWFLSRVGAVAAIPHVIFWSLNTLIPAWSVPYTWRTVAAFWVIYVSVRVGVQTIRHSEWDFSWDFSGF